MSAEPFGLYVHVPYCAARCPYCDFNTYVVPTPPWQAFVHAVSTELDARADAFDGAALQTVYFGGGTPSLMPAGQLEELLRGVQARWPIPSGAEVTLEANPGSVDAAALRAFRTAGINRVSIGWQSTHDRLLRVLGRGHDAAASRDCTVAARAAGFDNVSVDLIFAVPGQSLDDLEQDLDALVQLRPEHVSLYALTYHAGTELESRRRARRITPISEELELLMMERIRERLVGAGYEHYEVSNYALPGFRARHNSLYWSGTPYLGLGPGAHSFQRSGWEQGWRWETTRAPEAYYAAAAGPMEGGIPRPGDPAISFVEELSPRQLMTERMLTGLRLSDGIRLDEPALRSFGAEVHNGVRKAEAAGWAVRDGNVLRPTVRGLQYADALAELFF